MEAEERVHQAIVEAQLIARHSVLGSEGESRRWRRESSTSVDDFWQKLKYRNPKGHRSAIRISRIVWETLRLGMEGVRWFVMGTTIQCSSLRIWLEFCRNTIATSSITSGAHRRITCRTSIFCIKWLMVMVDSPLVTH